MLIHSFDFASYGKNAGGEIEPPFALIASGHEASSGVGLFLAVVRARTVPPLAGRGRQLPARQPNYPQPALS